MYDCLIKEARVIDPSQGIDAVLDIAIEDGHIEKIGPDIPAATASATYMMSGKIVTPGLIDAHCHPVLGFSDRFVHPDEAGIHAGVHLVNDGGSAGSANFYSLQQLFGENQDTKMTFFVNMASFGLIRQPEIRCVSDVDTDELKSTIAKYRPAIKGIKIRAMESLTKIDTDIIELALAVAGEVDLPLMVHLGEFRERKEHDPMDSYSRGVVKRLRKGDIVSHFMTERPGGMVLPDGTIYPELREAKERGVFLDSCHGKNNFSFTVARRLLDEGLAPNLISTDLSALGAPFVQSLPVTMSKFLALGMSLYDVVQTTTYNPAVALGIEEEWGSLQVGRRANISILELEEGSYEFFDGSAGHHLHGNMLLEPRMVLKDGRPHPCRSYYHLPAEAAGLTPV